MIALILISGYVGFGSAADAPSRLLALPPGACIALSIFLDEAEFVEDGL